MGELVDIYNTDKKYQIIYADPPWWYRDRRNKYTRFCGGARHYYDLMKTEEIIEVPVSKISDDSCILFLWATFPCLEEAFKVIKGWGFKYKTVGFVWVKLNRRNLQPFFGIGYYTKCLEGSTSICVMDKISKEIKSILIKDLMEYDLSRTMICAPSGVYASSSWKHIFTVEKTISSKNVYIETPVGDILCSHNHLLPYKDLCDSSIKISTAEEIYKIWSSNKSNLELIYHSSPTTNPSIKNIYGKISYIKIDSINTIESELEMYDISVEDELFIANDIVSHNSNAEICLLATKGEIMKPASNKVSSVVMYPRMEHSRKPDEVRDRIDQLYPNATKIELFSRKQVKGWDCWGIETNKFTDDSDFRIV